MLRQFFKGKQKVYAGEVTLGKKNKETRDKWLEEILQSIPKGETLLDAGAGEQQYREFCKHLSYKSQDFCEYMPTEEKEGLQEKKWDYSGIDIISDINNMPLESNSIDNVLCSEVLEHVFNPLEALMELKRVLKDGGRMIITVPFCSLTHFYPHFYQSGFGDQFFYRFAEEQGFVVERIDANGNYFEYLAQEMRRIESIARKYSKASEERIREVKSVINSSLVGLQEISDLSSNSEELLCFGFNVVLKKEKA